jgi:hypothetical protein
LLDQAQQLEMGRWSRIAIESLFTFWRRMGRAFIH